MVPNSPCYQCADKCIGCHSTCEKYKSFRSNLDEFKDMVYQIKKKNKILNSFKAESIRRFRKARNLKK